MADYHLYVTNSARERIARIDDWQQLTMLLKFNDVGKWTLQLPEGEPAQLLARTGGIAVERDGVAFFSGPQVDQRGRSWRALTGVHTRTFAGSDDNAYLGRPLALPVPSGPPYSGAAYDAQEGSAETLLKHYVEYNLGPSATAARRIAGLTVAADTSPNLLDNYGFETPGGGGADMFAGWTEALTDGTVVDETSIVHAGSHAAKLTAGATKDTRVYQVKGVVAGQVMAVAFWARGDGTHAGRYDVYDATHGAPIIAVQSTGVTGTDWAKVVAPFTVPAGCTSVRVTLWCPDAAASIAYIDDVQLHRGVHLADWARFDTLQGLLRDLALRGGGLGYRVAWTGSGLEFQTYETEDLSDLVVFSMDTGTLDGLDVIEDAPAANYCIAGGSGEGTARVFVEMGDSSSIVRWGRRVERFIDQPATSDTGELFKACTEELARNAERISITLQPAETAGLQAFTHYNLGDRVRVDLPDQTITDIVRGIEITVTPDGETIKPIVGTAESLAAASPLAGSFAKMRDLEARISALERR